MKIIDVKLSDSVASETISVSSPRRVVRTMLGGGYPSRLT